MGILFKVITVLFWVLAGVVWWEGYQNFLVGWIPKVALVLIVVHLVEVAVYWVAFRAKSRFPRLDAFLVLVFGVFHLYKFFKKEPRVASF